MVRSTTSFPRLAGRAVLSPMAGVTDVAYRALCKQYGAAMTYTEFVSSTAIVRANEKTLHMLATDEIEDPVAVQLFGANEADVIEAAKRVEDMFDVIDINCGCPAWKVIKTGAGSELLKQPQKIASFVNKLSSAVQKPVTVKIRAGIDNASINAVEIAKLLEDAGAAAIAIHGRTQAAGYSGKADWNVIKQVKDAVSIPVIGNGDVFDAMTFKQRLEESSVDAIMIARGAIGNPGIFREIEHLEKTGELVDIDPLPCFFEYLQLAKKHAIPFAALKTHAVSFTKGMVGGSNVRQALNQIHTPQELEFAMKEFAHKSGYE